MQDFVAQLSQDHPTIAFVAGSKFYWSPKDASVYYNRSVKNNAAKWALLHELSHGLLGHTTYHTDFELLQLEVAAWEKAKQLGPQYDIAIAEDHIQDCIDTYRDWLHARSTCPACGDNGIQNKQSDYFCLNCKTTWHVSSERFCRAYRTTKK